MCECVNKVNELLKDKGVRLAETYSINPETHNFESNVPLITTEWIDGKKPRGKSLPLLSSAYCPFCGKEKLKGGEHAQEKETRRTNKASQ